MKKFLSFIFGLMIFGAVSATTINLNWRVDGDSYAQTTCESGGDLNIPSTPPTKYGYTFGGWVDGDYIKLDYIESTGTQYIDTGIKASTELNLKVVARLKSYGTIFGSRIVVNNTTTTNALWFSALSTRTIWLYGNSTQYNHLPVISLNIWHEIKTIGGSYYLDSSLVATYSEQTIANGQNISLFAANNGEAQILADDLQISSFIIYDSNDRLIQNLVPARRASDAEVGMYDTVSGTFFTNSGTGTFIAGPASANQNF